MHQSFRFVRSIEKNHFSKIRNPMAKRPILIRVLLLLYTHVFRTSGVASQCCQLHFINSSSAAGGMGMRTRIPSVFVQKTMISESRPEVFVKAQDLPNEDADTTTRMSLESEIEEAMADTGRCF